MSTVTIPKKITGGEELVVISRKEYEKFLRVTKTGARSGFDRGLDDAIQEVRKGKKVGPFRSAQALKRSLEK